MSVYLYHYIIELPCLLKVTMRRNWSFLHFCAIIFVYLSILQHMGLQDTAQEQQSGRPHKIRDGQMIQKVRSCVWSAQFQHISSPLLSPIRNTMLSDDGSEASNTREIVLFGLTILKVLQLNYLGELITV